MTGRRILLVEDEALIALDVADALSEAGYVVVGPADRVEAALALAKQEGLDAAVLDVNLNGVPVWPVATALATRGIPFVLMTGLSDVSGVPNAFRGVPCLGKPASEFAMLDAVAAILR